MMGDWVGRAVFFMPRVWSKRWRPDVQIVRLAAQINALTAKIGQASTQMKIKWMKGRLIRLTARHTKLQMICKTVTKL
jgi:hypothetical protein